MSVLNFKKLCEVFDCRQSATLKRIMTARGVRWSLDRAGKPWTTEAELDRVIAAPQKVLTFTKPPCRNNKSKSRSPVACAKSTAPGITSPNTDGPSYAE